MENHLVPVVCVLIRRVSAIQGSGLEGLHGIIQIFSVYMPANVY